MRLQHPIRLGIRQVPRAKAIHGVNDMAEEKRSIQSSQRAVLLSNWDGPALFGDPHPARELSVGDLPARWSVTL